MLAGTEIRMSDVTRANNAALAKVSFATRHERSPRGEVQSEKQREEQQRRDGAFGSCVFSLPRNIRRHIKQSNADTQRERDYGRQKRSYWHRPKRHDG